MKKNFVKKLAVVLSLAMTVSTLAPAASVEAGAAAKTKFTTYRTNVYDNGTNDGVYKYTVKNVKKGYTVKWSLEGKGAKYVDLDVASTKAKGTTVSNNITVDVAGAKAAKNATFKVKATTYNTKGKKVGYNYDTVTIKIEAKSVSLATKSGALTVETGKELDFDRTLTPANSTSKTYYTVAAEDGTATTNATITASGVFKATKEGKYVVTATVKNSKKAEKVLCTKTAVVTVTGEEKVSVPEIKELKATKVNELTATFAGPVASDKVTLAVTKGTAAFEVASVTWNADKTVATIKTTAKMTKATYTLTATATDGKQTASVNVEDQAIAEIKVLNPVALTGKYDVDGNSTADAAGEVYVYYDVVDQYGESLKTSTSITWSTSCGTPAGDDRTLGKLTLRRSDRKAFTYGEQIFVTGVNAQTGKSVNATLTVGAEQALNNVVVKGFVKKNSTEILSTLPSGFKTGAYYMIYSVTDQNGNPTDSDYFLNTTNVSGVQQVTFIFDNVLVIKEFTESGKLVTIDGITYSAANVVPGMYVDKGGEVNITSIANKTGNKSSLNVVVGENAVLKSFVMSTPELIADGETVEIPFTATDVNGKAITNFAVLANNINKLTFSASDGTILTLKEKNDGTAKLQLTDASSSANWGANSTDGIDRPVALTAIVVGGETNNLMVSIKDKARPDAISNVDVAAAILEGGSETIDFKGDGSTTHSDFTYLDQYGRKIAKDYNYNDNGFFSAAKTGLLSGIEFSSYEFGVKMTYKGNVGALVNAPTSPVNLKTDSVTHTLTADTKTQTAITGESLKFEIAKIKAGDPDWSATSAAYNTTFAVVDITQVKNLTVADLNKQYIGTDKSKALTGEGVTMTDQVTSANALTSHNQTVKVTGTFNGKSVTVPAAYCDASTADGKLSVTTGAAVTITTNPGSNLMYKHLYDATTARYTRKDAKDTLEVKVNELYSNVDFTTLPTPVLYDTASKAVVISDAYPEATTIEIGDTGVYLPDNTSITNLDPEYWDDDTVTALVVRDQYAKAISTTNIYKVSKVVENAEGYAENNFKVAGNATTSANIAGAERGDTFVLTITATDTDGNYVTKDVAVTVGADTSAKIVNSTNTYVDTLVKNYLEPQRIAGLN